MHENCRLESGKCNGKRESLSKPEIDQIDRNHVLSERKRREKINERFLILGSLVPSGGKVLATALLFYNCIWKALPLSKASSWFLATQLRPLGRRHEMPPSKGGRRHGASMPPSKWMEAWWACQILHFLR
ncbi:unnamed protein product [Fraxinus pennsylvanica]|uniref:BHLH domain-containing protein n=1 Tax=Fraxinus pennsylvanica TaxID=56036 RepID=A0AAD1YQD1_9LAMI|nr:unnamed protein product [Fraxinus pennsylvanica]